MKLKANKQTPLLSEPPPAGKVLPVPPSKKGVAKTSLELHDGIVPGQAPPFALEPSRWGACLLHCRMYIIGSLFKNSIVKRVQSEEATAALHALLTKHGMVIKD